MAVDPETKAMLLRHCVSMDERAAACGLEVASDAFVFSLEPDCSLPMGADYLTKRVAILKEYLGISTKRPEVVGREDEALRLFRHPAKRRPKGKTGPELRGGMSYEEIGRRLGRSTRWALDAVAAAGRREAAAQRGAVDFFDGSIVALRKFTSSELLDAGCPLRLPAVHAGCSAHPAYRWASAPGRVVHWSGRPGSFNLIVEAYRSASAPTRRASPGSFASRVGAERTSSAPPG